MEAQGSAREQLRLELAVKLAQLEEVKMKARLAAAEAEARFAEDIGSLEQEAQALKQQLKAAGGIHSGTGDAAWNDLCDGVSQSTKALGNLIRNALDRM
ncbi:MAG: hypothetical protein GX087_01580 [Desulfobulbaceae bacterium]|nr:hypothetical protein [Desulfobulbaceae bacterium]